jgi:hypothetical protein
MAKYLEETGSEYVPLVITSNTGHKQSDILQHVNSHSKTICLTVWANVLGVTVPQWDTVIHASEYDSSEFWFQLSFRGGSTPNCFWKVIDLVPERGIQSFVEMASAISAAKGETESDPVLKTLVEYADIYEFNEGFTQMTFEDLVQSGLGSVASAEAEVLAAQHEVIAGGSLEEMYAIFGGGTGGRTVVFQAEINNNGTQGSSNVRLVGRRDSLGETDMAAEAKKGVKQAVRRVDDVIWGALLRGEHLDSLPKVLAYDKFSMCTGCSGEQFERAIETGWIPSAENLNRRINRIYNHLSAALKNQFTA